MAMIGVFTLTLAHDLPTTKDCSAHCIEIDGVRECDEFTRECVPVISALGVITYCDAGWTELTCTEECSCGTPALNNISCTVAGECSACEVNFSLDAEGACTACATGYETAGQGAHTECDYCSTNYAWADADPPTCTICPDEGITLQSGPHQNGTCVAVV